MSAGRLERQRERIRGLIDADPQRSSRSIAQEVGCSPHTVIRHRQLHMQTHATGGTDNGSATAAHAGSANLVAPAGPGNDRATTHGAYSEARRRPLVDEHRERLRLAHPNEPDDLVNLRARCSALIDLFTAHVSSCR